MKAFLLVYVFLFVCLFKIHAAQPLAKFQQQPKDCVKHPPIVNLHPTEKLKIYPEKIVKNSPIKVVSTIPHFSVLNFINFFYTKDTLDNLHVM